MNISTSIQLLVKQSVDLNESLMQFDWTLQAKDLIPRLFLKSQVFCTALKDATKQQNEVKHVLWDPQHFRSRENRPGGRPIRWNS